MNARKPALSTDLKQGWNTWNVRSVLSHVLLPEGFAISLGLKTSVQGRCLREALIGRRGNDVEQITPGPHAYDRSYTSLELEWHEMKDDLRKFCLGLIASLAAVTLAINVSAEEREVNMKHNIDWPSFMHKQDPVWTKMPRTWLETPYLGNGMMGTMVRQTGAQTVRWDVGRGDVQDHRPIYEGDLKNPTMFTRCRLPIGFFELKTVGKITGSTLRLDLWNAEATGAIQTDKGTIQWRSIVHADRMLILTEIKPSEGESGCRWEWNSLPAVSPRYTRGNKWEGYEFNPPPSETREANVNICVQPLLAGGQTATAWTISKGKGKRLLTVSVAHSYPEDTAKDEAVQTVKEAARASFDALAESHRAWWHDFYPQSFISIPDVFFPSSMCSHPTTHCLNWSAIWRL